MKKKLIIPLGTFIFIYLGIFLIVLALSIFFMVKRELQIYAYILLIVLNLVLLYYFISPVIFYTIKLKDGVIKINKDFGLFKEDRIQYKEEVKLKDVIEYRVILSNRDSRGEAYKTKVQKRKYIEFLMKDEEKKRIYVSYLNNKQLLKLVETIKEITNLEICSE